MSELATLTKAELIELVRTHLSTIDFQGSELQTHRDHLREQQHRLREQDIALQTKDQAIAQLTQERDEYKLAWNRLMQQRFGNRSERYLSDPDQLRLDFGDSDEAADAALGLADAVEDLEQIIPEHKRRSPRKKRDESLPAHLPRYEVVAEVPEALKHCDVHGEKSLLPESMWDQTETLEFDRPKMKVRVTKYPNYVCINQPECGIVSPERPTGIVEGSKYDSSIAAEIITGKYSYHLPLYRLQDYFAGSGWTPSRGTQCNILTGAYFVVLPLLEYFKKTVQVDSVVGTDETRVTLLYPKELPAFDLDDLKQRRVHEVFSEALEQKKPSISGRMWVYCGARVKLNVFDFTVSRHRDGPELFFADYRGTLLGDCYRGFESIVVASHGRITRAACNYHARRKIENSSAYPRERDQWLRWYQALAEIEDRARPLSDEERLELRQREARPVWTAMEEFLREMDQRTENVILPKSDLALALQYVRNHWAELQRYLDDGRVPFDNNETEQLMKQVAIGRKNWLFAGSLAGGERSAGFLTLCSSALRNDLDVWQYVKDVLDQLLTGCTDYASLLPWTWAAAHPEAIRQYRITERRTRAARKTLHRTARRRLHAPRSP